MRETRGVEELRGFEVIEGDPDVVGWEVVDQDGRRIGVVAELLADPENPSAHYLEVRLDHPAAGGPVEARPTGTGGDVSQDAIPELDSLSGQGGVTGKAAVPGEAPHEMPARTIGEALVRDSLLDVENQMTAGEHPSFDRGEGRTLIPAGQARFEDAMRRVHLDPHPSWSA